MSLLRRARPLRSGGADDAKPRWTLPAKDHLKYSYQPSIPDKHFFGAHWNYAPITMWFRAKRPGMEQIGSAVYLSGRNAFALVADPLRGAANRHCPGLLQKVVAAFAAWFTFSLIARSLYGAKMEAWMTLDKLHSYAQALRLQSEGFWRSEAEDTHERERLCAETSSKLKAKFSEALAHATAERRFDVFCAHLASEEPLSAEEEKILTSGYTWRFGLMPYGKGNADTRVFPAPASEQPGDAYQFMDMGNYGDYIDRRDNKPEPLRKARHLFASAYVPPTK